MQASLFSSISIYLSIQQWIKTENALWIHLDYSAAFSLIYKSIPTRIFGCIRHWQTIDRRSQFTSIRFDFSAVYMQTKYASLLTYQSHTHTHRWDRQNRYRMGMSLSIGTFQFAFASYDRIRSKCETHTHIFRLLQHTRFVPMRVRIHHSKKKHWPQQQQQHSFNFGK